MTVNPSSEQFSAKIALLSSVDSQVHVPSSVQTMTSLLGQEMEGISLSTTVISKEQVAVLPHSSVAVYNIVVVPIGNGAPEGIPLVNATFTF